MNHPKSVIHESISPLVSFVSVFLPASALHHLTRLNTVYPMLFKMTNRRTGRSTHCGVLEFEADDGKCYIPYWVIYNSYHL